MCVNFGQTLKNLNLRIRKVLLIFKILIENIINNYTIKVKIFSSSTFPFYFNVV